jgi:hypothetical protein
MSRTLRRLVPMVLVAAIGACGPDNRPDEEREVAPEIAPGTEPATIPGPSQLDSMEAQ